METANIILFYGLAALITIFSVLTVTANKIFRSVTYMLFVLVFTAGLYLMLNYHFLAAVQISVYAGGVVVLFLFAVMLTKASNEEEKMKEMRERFGLRSLMTMAITALGLGLTLFTVYTHKFAYVAKEQIVGDNEMSLREIGFNLVGTDKYQYLLPFEILGLLLLACIIGGLLIARKR